jgi:hypothetical protein
VAAHPDTLTIGGDLEVFRLGFGAMRITGPGSGASRPIRLASARCSATSSSATST